MSQQWASQQIPKPSADHLPPRPAVSMSQQLSPAVPQKMYQPQQMQVRCAHHRVCSRACERACVTRDTPIIQARLLPNGRPVAWGALLASTGDEMSERVA